MHGSDSDELRGDVHRTRRRATALVASTMTTQDPLRVGLTGGIASGKSAVSDRFGSLGITVLDADDIARELVEPGQPALAEIRAAFGDEYITTSRELDRRALRQHVFHDPEARRKLEAILHPRIRAALESRSALATSPYVIVSVPLLAEVGGYPWLDEVIVVDVTRATQLRRLLMRDRVDLELANRMLDAQVTREERVAIADQVIENEGTLAELDAAVAILDADLKYRAALRARQNPRMPATPNPPSSRTRSRSPGPTPPRA